tara:strand:- start:2690 stop:3094 length:405 start_codon:yes stop_codon:yes gene_type:complete
MKKTIGLSFLFLASCSPAIAETTQDHYKQVIIKKPYTVEVCMDAGGSNNGKSDITNFLEGAVIGGALGNNIKGEQGGGAIGAFLGGVLNTERNKTSGPRCQTETRYEEERQTIYSHSTVTFVHEGTQHTLRFNK